MGLIGSHGCVHRYSKKQCMTLFWRLRAAVRKAVKRNGGKKQFKFQYDPSSYALNFDDGCCNLGASGYAVKHAVGRLNSRKHHSSKSPASNLSRRTNQARGNASWP